MNQNTTVNVGDIVEVNLKTGTIQGRVLRVFQRRGETVAVKILLSLGKDRVIHSYQFQWMEVIESAKRAEKKGVLIEEVNRQQRARRVQPWVANSYRR